MYLLRLSNFPSIYVNLLNGDSIERRGWMMMRLSLATLVNKKVKLETIYEWHINSVSTVHLKKLIKIASTTN